MIRFFIAHVRNGRLILDELTDLPEGTHLELVSTDDVVKNGGDLLHAESEPTQRSCGFGVVGARPSDPDR